MSRTVYLDMDEGAVLARCSADKIGISAIERLPNGGIRLVCMSGDGAARIRQKLKKKLIEGDVVRERHRPRRPMW